MKDEREEFSRRLADAMKKAGYEPRPGVLLKVFNSRYDGTSVTFQSTSRWLGGKAIPEQDKLQVLAGAFGVEPHVLRFGVKARPARRIGEEPLPYPNLGARDRDAVAAYLVLPPKQRELVAELIAELARNNGKNHRG